MAILLTNDDKIRTVDELVEIASCLRADSKTVVHCHGVFDLLHPGHIRHLDAAKRFGDVLIVTITADEHVNKGPQRPVFNEQLRAQSVAALQCVDLVAINKAPNAVDVIRKLHPDYYVKGAEYADSASDITGMIDEEAGAVAAVGGEIRFTDGITFSSTHLLNAHFPVYPDASDGFLREMRQKYRPSDVRDRLQSLRRLKVLLIGDTIIDQYHYCSPLGMSSKDVFLVTKHRESEMFAGGVVAAANHLAGFCGIVDMVTCLGTRDSMEQFIRRHLKPGVRPTIFRTAGRTVMKSRFVEPAFLRKMFEVCYLDEATIPPRVERRICDHISASLKGYDVVVVADFGHGAIGSKMIEVLCDQAPFLAVNAQTNSANIGFNLITKYPRADYVCIDEPELRLATRDQFGDIRPLISEIAQRLECSKVSITRGAHGALTFSSSEGFFTIPVFSNKVVDTVGAGDAYLAITSPCVADGFPMDLVGLVGNVVGSLAVQIVGNRGSIDPVAVHKSLAAILG